MLRVRTSRARRGVPVGVLVAVCVTAQLSTLVHFALVRHSFCAAHGEAVDLDVADASRAPAAPPCNALAFSHDESSSDTHDHCALAIDRSGRARLSPAPAVLVPVALAAELSREPAPLERGSRAALLFLAPKTSPPA